MSTRTGDGAVTSFEKPENISWEAATVELPPMPVIPPGADAMSMTISAVLPTLEAMMTANVTSLAAKENTFSGKVGAAQAAYNVGDESAGQCTDGSWHIYENTEQNKRKCWKSQTCVTEPTTNIVELSCTNSVYHGSTCDFTCPTGELFFV